jgi:hypothetical protein
MSTIENKEGFAKPRIEYGLMEFSAGHPYKMECFNARNCVSKVRDSAGNIMNGVIPPNSPYFVDLKTNEPMCKSCGARLRYHRKKAEARGDEQPATLDDVKLANPEGERRVIRN